MTRHQRYPILYCTALYWKRRRSVSEAGTEPPALDGRWPPHECSYCEPCSAGTGTGRPQLRHLRVVSCLSCRVRVSERCDALRCDRVSRHRMSERSIDGAVRCVAWRPPGSASGGARAHWRQRHSRAARFAHSRLIRHNSQRHSRNRSPRGTLSRPAGRSAPRGLSPFLRSPLRRRALRVRRSRRATRRSATRVARACELALQ